VPRVEDKYDEILKKSLLVVKTLEGVKNLKILLDLGTSNSIIFRKYVAQPDLIITIEPSRWITMAGTILTT
jgi:hypothetical protein